MATAGSGEGSNGPKAPRTKIIRDLPFAKRFDQACDNYLQVPPKHAGRLVWVKNEFKKRYNESISMETVRKWFSGEAKPRADKVAKIAEILQVDVGWLSLGIDPTVAPKERKARNAMADGAVNIVAGLIQMDGGHPAFPTETETNNVDLHAIIKGAKYDIHVSLGEVQDDQVTFGIPHNYEDLVVLGIVRRGMAITIYDISSDAMAGAAHHAGGYEITVAESSLTVIPDFTRRL